MRHHTGSSRGDPAAPLAETKSFRPPAATIRTSASSNAFALGGGFRGEDQHSDIPADTENSCKERAFAKSHESPDIFRSARRKNGRFLRSPALRAQGAETEPQADVADSSADIRDARLAAVQVILVRRWFGSEPTTTSSFSLSQKKYRRKPKRGSRESLPFRCRSSSRLLPPCLTK